MAYNVRVFLHCERDPGREYTRLHKGELHMKENITQKFLETQLREAQEEKEKNEKLYSKLGTTIGLAIVIVLC